MSNPPKILETLKSSIPFVFYVRAELKKRAASDGISILTDVDLVKGIFENSPEEMSSKLPPDSQSQEALYKAVAAQIKITEKIKGKDSVSEDDLMQLLQESFIQEVIRESGVNNEEISKKISGFFKNLPNLSWCANHRKMAASDSLGKLALSIIDTLEITDDELKILATKKNTIIFITQTVKNKWYGSFNQAA